MRKFASVLSVMVFIPSLVFAQSAGIHNATSNTQSIDQTLSNADLQKLVQDLLKQLQALQQQVAALRGELGQGQTTSTAPALDTYVVVSEAIPPELTRSLSRGFSGDDVRKLQEFLAKDKNIYPDGLITGYFGPLTEAAVKKWQEKHDIESVGAVGPKTIAKFRELGGGRVQELIQEGAGQSGVIPPGLLVAPGIQTKIATTTGDFIYSTSTVSTTTIPIVSTTSTVATTTQPTSTPPASPSGSGGSSPPPPTLSPSPSTATTTVTSTTDTASPSIPTGLSASAVSTSQINLTWLVSTDNIAVVGYKVYRSGTFLINVVATSTTNAPTYYSDSSLLPSVAYVYTVAAYDAAGNASAQSSQVSATTQAVIPPVPPSPSHACGNPINVPADTASIQSALNAACSGDTVYVAAGTYDENVVVPKENLTLKGAPGTSPENVIVEAPNSTGYVISTGETDYFTVEGLTLQGGLNQGNNSYGGSGLFANSNSASKHLDITARNLIIKNNTNGIQIKNFNSGSITIEKNLIMNNTLVGVNLGHNGSLAILNVLSNTIANNTGVYGAYYDGGAIVGDRRVFRNNIFANNSAGITSAGGNTWITDLSNPDVITILYNDFWNNTSGNYVNSTTGGSFTPSPATGELEVDPQFVSPTDYHLQATSPAKDMGVYPSTGTPASSVDVSLMLANILEHLRSLMLMLQKF